MALPVLRDNIPDELQQFPQWVAWRMQPRPGETKPTKVPYQAKPELSWYKASSTKPETWTTFAQAIRCYNTHCRTPERLRRDEVAEEPSVYLDGVGFVLTDSDPFVAWDFDHCLDVESGEINSDVLAIVKTLNSYTEVSPSGAGLRVIVKGKLTRSAKKGDFEAYQSERFVTLTGNHMAGTPLTVEKRQEAINRIHSDIFGSEPDKKAAGPAVRSEFPIIADDADLLNIARTAKNGDKFKRLNDDGDITGYPSPSEARLALTSIFAFYCGPDPERIDRLFRASALMETKWDSTRGDTTIGGMTIETALDGRTEFYKPRTGGSMDYGEINMSDLGNARRLMEAFGSELHHITAWKNWLYFDGTRWVIDQTGAVRRRAHKTINDIFSEAAQLKDAERKKLWSFALASEAEARINAMVNEARWLEGTAITTDVLDTDPYLLNVKNGTLDLRTLALLPHDRNQMLTKMAPVIFDAEAKCPTWNEFLKRVQPNREIRCFIKRAVGLSLTGDVGAQCFFFLYGNGQNGKSTFIEVLNNLLGDYWGKTKAVTLMHKSRPEGGASNDVADLFGRRFISVSEIGEGHSLDEALVKDLTGGDAITARHLFKENFTFLPTFKVWMYGNHKPNIRGTDNGIWRRVKMVPFTVQIPKEERDYNLKSKLIAELPGILNWALEGCAAWLAEGLGEPEEVTAATKDYREEMDALGTFIEDCCTEELHQLEGATKLYNKYRKWCEDTGEYAKNQRKFGQALSERGFVKEKMRVGYVYLGLSLNPEIADYET